MRAGIITGSGSYEWPSLAVTSTTTVSTRFGDVHLTEGTVGAVDVIHLARHGPSHARLSNQIQHRANLTALIDRGVDFVISLTVCGALDPAAELGFLVVFDDLYFPSNRLPDGSLCTWHDTPGAAGRGHWIFDLPFSEALRGHAIAAARELDIAVIEHGCYGHVDGPRFNSRSEIAALAGNGVTAVSQSAGPEIVLAGEAEVPILLLGYLTDHANAVRHVPQPVGALIERMHAATGVFARIVDATLSRVLAVPPPVGTNYRFDA
ncbi:MAG: phosphorylase [Pseudonocardiales bacterium]|nr:MAG: phosphorylase [Pseudonocardiales bacterium]